MNRELLLLGLLHRQEMHGYELQEFINTRLSSCTDMKKATAYYLLKKMEAEGWLVQETTQEGNRPPRQVYSLTEAGERAFQRLLREHLAAYHPAYLQDDISLAFLDTLPVEEARQLLSERRAILQSKVESANQLAAHPGSLALVLEHWRHHLNAELAWLDSVLERLATPDTTP